jgi:peroxiredoxin
VAYGLAPEFRGARFERVLTSFRILNLTALFFALAISSHALASELKAIDESPKPNFSLQDLDGRIVPLKAFKGRTVLVHFFATWCEPCREELPALNRFLNRSAPDTAVIAISVADADPRVKRFFAQVPVGFPVLLDRDRAVAKSWKVQTLPTTYLLNADLKPRFVVEAEFAWDTVSIEPKTGKIVRNNSREANPTPERLKALEERP